MFFFFFKQKTAYEMRISDWSSDVCSSDLRSRTRSGPMSAGTRPSQPTRSRPGTAARWRSEERRVGKEWSVRVDLGGRRIIKKKKKKVTQYNNDQIKNTSSSENDTILGHTLKVSRVRHNNYKGKHSH